MKYICPYCGHERGSESGTPSDIECCGEIGHAVTEEEYEAAEAQNELPQERSDA